MILIVFLVIDIAIDIAIFHLTFFYEDEPKIYSDDKMIVRCF